MPMPHQEMRRMVKRRISGTEGNERLAILRDCLEMCPNYYNGPYGELRKWICDLIEQTRVQKAIRHQDQFSVPKEGAAQIVLVGPPNAGKSSLLRALTGRQVAIGDYPFTTLRPIAGMLQLSGAVVQLVDLPGLLQGAVDGKGGGRALIGCVRSADAVLFLIPATQGGLGEGAAVIDEVVAQAGIELPAGIVLTKSDLLGTAELPDEFRLQFSGYPLVSCSASNGDGLEGIKDLIWQLTGLMRVYPKRRGASVASDAVVLRAGSTVEDFVCSIHRDWLARFKQARIYGTSAKFPGMAVGLNHALSEGDAVELLMTK